MKIKEIYGKYKEKYVGLFGRSFFHDVVILTMLSIYALIVVSVLLVLIFRVRSGTGVIPLSYNVFYGVTSQGSWVNLYLYLFGYALLGFLNFFVAWAFFDKERLISYLMGLISIVIGVLFMINIYNLTVLVV
jgi:hypothetical protein